MKEGWTEDGISKESREQHSWGRNLTSCQDKRLGTLTRVDLNWTGRAQLKLSEAEIPSLTGRYWRNKKAKENGHSWAVLYDRRSTSGYITVGRPMQLTKEAMGLMVGRAWAWPRRWVCGLLYCRWRLTRILIATDLGSHSEAALGRSHVGLQFTSPGGGSKSERKKKTLKATDHCYLFRSFISFCEFFLDIFQNWWFRLLSLDWYERKQVNIASR